MKYVLVLILGFLSVAKGDEKPSADMRLWQSSPVVSDSMVFSFASTPVMVISAKDPIVTVNGQDGKTLAIVHKDGKVDLKGKSNDAARQFWKAVSLAAPYFIKNCEPEHALTKPSGYHAAHGHTDPHARD